MSIDGVAVTLYFGNDDNYVVVGYAGNKREAEKYFKKLISGKEIITIGNHNINFANVNRFTVKG